MSQIYPSSCSMRSLAALALLLPFTGAGCSDDDVAEPSLAVATYNTGLAKSYVDYATERAPLVIEALAEQDVDVLCVQEVWDSEDWDALKEASPLKNTLHLPPIEEDAGDAALCTEAELTPLGACVMEKCDVGPGELTNCALANCGAQVGALSSECQGCITGVIGTLSLTEIIAACGPGGEGSSGYAYGGSFGIGLLSYEPFEAEDSLVFSSTSNRRGVLYGKTRAADGLPVHVFCTHLSANLSNVPYTGTLGSWELEQTRQIRALTRFINDKTSADDRIVLLGDLNTGPKEKGIAAELPANYAMFESDGFENAYLQSGDVQCTFCASNALQPENPDPSVLIDHVLLKGFGETPYSTSQIMRGEITIRSNGTAVDTAYSDHYGLRTEFKLY